MMFVFPLIFDAVTHPSSARHAMLSAYTQRCRHPAALFSFSSEAGGGDVFQMPRMRFFFALLLLPCAIPCRLPAATPFSVLLSSPLTAWMARKESRRCARRWRGVLLIFTVQVRQRYMRECLRRRHLSCAEKCAEACRPNR